MSDNVFVSELSEYELRKIAETVIKRSEPFSEVFRHALDVLVALSINPNLADSIAITASHCGCKAGIIKRIDGGGSR